MNRVETDGVGRGHTVVVPRAPVHTVQIETGWEATGPYERSSDPERVKSGDENRVLVRRIPDSNLGGLDDDGGVTLG